MNKIAIVTDSNSGITQDEGRSLGVFVLPMPFYINEVMYLEGITLSQEEFYERLQKDETISTSQPSPGEARTALLLTTGYFVWKLVLYPVDSEKLHHLITFSLYLFAASLAKCHCQKNIFL